MCTSMNDFHTLLFWVEFFLIKKTQKLPSKKYKIYYTVYTYTYNTEVHTHTYTQYIYIYVKQNI